MGDRLPPAAEDGDEVLFHNARLIEAGRLAAVANHEMRQPLLGIKAFSQLIADRPDVPDEVRAWATRINEQSQRLERIVSGLRGLARPARQLRQRVQLDEAVGAVVEFATFLFREPRVVLEHRLASRAAVEVSTDELQQVLLNLLGNARDAVVGQGGGRVQLVSAVADGWADLYVADDGPGVPAAVRADLDACFRSTKSNGTGLGLAVSREIARAHGGSLDLLDDGPPAALLAPARTIFRLRLPAR